MGAFDLSGDDLTPDEAARSLAAAVPGEGGGLAARTGSVGNEADEITPEIQALADGLRRDPLKIYEFVYNYIDYQCYYGSKKGAQLTLMERSGNDMDQAALLVALLRASGQTASYAHGPCAFPLSVYSAWWGISPTPYGHISDAAIATEYGLTSPDAATLALYRSLKGVQDQAYLGGYFNAWPVNIGGVLFVSIPFTYVEFTSGGTLYNLSPAYKAYTRVTGIDLITASQYNRINFLSAAGGTPNTAGQPDSILGLSGSGINTALTGYTNNLLTAFRAGTTHEKSVQQLLGGRKITKKSYSSFNDILQMLPDTAATWGTMEYSNNIWPAKMSKLEITAGVTGTYNEATDTFSGTPLLTKEITMPSLQGKKLSLAFSGTGGNTATIRLDNETKGSFTVSGADVQIRLKAKHGHYSLNPDATATTWTVVHPNNTDQPFTAKYTKGTDNAYAFIYSFDGADRHLRSRQQKLEALRQAGTTGWELASESMDVMGLSYFKQVRDMEKASGVLYDCIPMNHHAFGRAAQEGGNFYIDVGLVLVSPIHYTMSEPVKLDYSGMAMLYTSAMEHGVIEQTQGSGAMAISTVRLVSAANAAGKKIFRATSSNKTSVLSSLTAGTYSTPNKNAISSRLATADDKMLLPETGTITVGTRTMGGYAYEGKNLFLMLIDTLNGGYNASGQPYSPTQAASGYNSNPGGQLGKTSGFNASYQTATSPGLFSWDPIEMASGAYVMEKSDLVLGNGEAPLGLAFTRAYHSNRNTDNSAGMGYGWTHNNDVFITERSAPEALLGGANGYQMAPMIASMIAAKDLHTGHTTAKQWATSALAVHWGLERMKYTAVAVSIGTKTIQFIRMPDGTYMGPPGITFSLTGNTSTNYVMTERNGNIWTFNSDKKLASIANRNGATQTFTYNGSKQLTSVKDAFNRTLTYTWSGTSLSSISDGSRTVSCGYGSGDLTSFTDPENKVWTYGYLNHRISSLSDPASRVIASNEYDSWGRVSTQRSMGDATREWTYVYADFVNTEIDPDSGVSQYLHDERGRSIGKIDPRGYSPVTAYDGQDRKITELSKKNERYDWYYDANNNLESSQDERGYYTDYYYDGQLRLTDVYDRRGKHSIYTYTGNHQLQTATDPLGHVTTYAYTAKGQFQTVTDGENKTTTTAYDSNGAINKITRHDGTFQSFTNDAAGNVLTSTDAKSRTTTYTWNKRRQSLTTTLPQITGEAAAVVTNTYDNSGNLASMTDAKGNVTGYTFNALGKKETTTEATLSAGNNVITTTFNKRDLPVEVVNSLTYKVVTGYDAGGNPTLMTDPLNRSTTSTFDANGRMTEITDPLNQITKQVWNARGEKTKTTDALTANVDQTFDGNGNKTQLKNRRGKTFITVFDDANRTTSIKTPTNKTTSTTYWNNDLVKTIQEPSGQTTTFTYNGKDLLSTKVDPLGTITYGYDDSGMPETATEGSNVITRTYDERGRVKTYKVTEAGVDQYLLQYKYGANNNLARVTYPDGKQVNYTYNSRNLMETVTDWRGKTTTYSYDRVGRVTGISRPNGTSASFSRDAASQLGGIRETAGGVLFSYVGIGYDDGSQIKTRVQAPLVNTAWQHPATTATYDDDNRLLTFAGASVTHDSDGNMTNGPISPTSGAVALVYNSRNQLTNAGGISYAYDAEGVRRNSTDPGGTTRYVTDPHTGLSRVLVKIAPSGEKTFYVYGIGLLYEVDEADSSKTYHFDQVGNTIVRTDETGNVIGRAAYSAYGLSAWQQGDMATPFLSNGNQGVTTEASGLLYMRARYYSPYLMRFLNSDPIGFSGGLNWYLFGDGNPISRSDASGLWFGIDDAIFSGVGAVIGVVTKAAVNVATGSEHHWQDYVGAAVGGAVAGEVLLYTANPFIAGAAGGAAANVTNQTLNIATGRQESFNLSSLAVDTGVGALTGFIPGAKVPGISAGRGSYAQVFEQIVTKAGNGTISTITDQTAMKMVQGAFTKYAFVEGTNAAGYASWVYGAANDKLKATGRK